MGRNWCLLAIILAAQARAALGGGIELEGQAARECALVRKSIEAILATEDFPGKTGRLERYREQEKVLCGDDRKAANRLANERLREKCKAMSRLPQSEQLTECKKL